MPPSDTLAEVLQIVSFTLTVRYYKRDVGQRERRSKSLLIPGLNPSYHELKVNSIDGTNQAIMEMDIAFLAKIL
jgi:hypothetical protein